jgi:hypothetical protein
MLGVDDTKEKIYIKKIHEREYSTGWLKNIL